MTTYYESAEGLYQGKYCRDCGRLLIDADRDAAKCNGIDIAGTPLCAGCQSQYTTCDDCGATVRIDDTRTIADNVVCDDCYGDNYFRCVICGEDQHNDDQAGDYDGEPLCQSCYDDDFITCEQCGIIVNSVDAHAPGDRFLCRDCFDSSYGCCSDCGEIDLIDNLFYSEIDDASYCSRCLPNHRAIQNYSYKPAWEFNCMPFEHGRPHLYMGIELEVENKMMTVDNEVAAQEMMDQLPAICKEDSSINDGFEIVLHPQTMAYAKHQEKIIDIALGYLRKNSFAGHNYGGMHVHLEKKAFSNLQVVKFVRLFSHNEEFWTIISQRKKGNLERWASFNNNLPERDLTQHKGKYVKVVGNSVRYAALNFTDATIEVRIFNSTIRTDRFFKNLEACQAAFDFSRDYGLADMTAERFAAFVYSHRPHYPNLAAFLAERRMYIHTTGKTIARQLFNRADRLRVAVGM